MSPLIRKRVSACRRRLNWINLLEKASVAVLVGLICGAVLMLASRVRELALYDYALPGAGALVLLSLAAALIWAYVTRLSPFAAAVAIDERLNLKERVSTALCYPATERPIERAVIEDAELAAKAIHPRRNFPLPAQRSFYWSVLPLALIAGLQLFVPHFSLFGKAKPPLLKQSMLTPMEIKAVEKIEKQVSDIIESEDLSENLEARKLKGELEKMVRKAKIGEFTRPQVVGELSSLADKLRKREEELGDKMKPRSAGDSMSKRQYTGAVKKNMDKGKYQESAIQLDALKKKIEQDLKSGEMSKEDQKQLAKELQDLAKTAGKDSELGQALSQAAKAAAQGNAGQLSQQMNQAVQNMQDMESLMTEMAAIQSMQSLINQQKQSMCKNGQPGQSGQQGDKPGQSSQQGQAGKPGQSNQQGQGQSQSGQQGTGQQGQTPPGGNQGKTGQQSTPGGQLSQNGQGGQGSASGQAPDGAQPFQNSTQKSNGQKQQGVGRGGGGGGTGRGGVANDADGPVKFEKTKLKHKMDEGVILSSMKVNGPQYRGEATAEFTSVIEQYEQESEETLEREQIPLHMKDTVGDYFDAIRPQLNEKKK